MSDWKLLRIPKLAHFYWGGKQLTFLQYLSIYTFWKLNPDWTINLHTPKVATENISWSTHEQKYEFTGKNYYKDALNVGVVLREWDFKQFGMTNDMSEVHKSDILRWYLLSTEGGLWSDFDILYFKPMSSLCFNTQMMSNFNTFVSICRYGHSIGFLLSSRSNPYFARILNNARSNYKPNEYQSMGVRAINNSFPNINVINNTGVSAYNIPMDVVYPYDASNIIKLLNTNDSSNITPNTIGIHWYAGHPQMGAFLIATAGGEVNIGTCVLTTKLKECLLPLHAYLNVRLSTTDTILDLGCGDKSFSNKLIGKVTTVDAWEKFNPDIVWNLEQTPIPKDSKTYDYVIMMDVIEHLDKANGFKLIEEAKRIARKGVFLLTPLWWQTNEHNITDPKSPYYNNHFDLHKSLWKNEDFVGWEIITNKGEFENYFVGLWRP